MNNTLLRQIMACYSCKSRLTYNRYSGYCKKCKIRIKLDSGIWHGLGKLSPRTDDAKRQYDSLFNEEFGGPNDGSYEILSRLANGNRTIDISCGAGLIEKLSPNTVGVDFSLTALKQAQMNGAKYLVLADAHQLPFKDNAFDVAISSGNLEHFENPLGALTEMARISRIQVLIVHRFPPLPFAKTLFDIVSKLFHVQHQPIERPLTSHELDQLLIDSNLHAVFRGVWTLPFNYGKVIRWLPELKIFSSAWFVISIKK